MSRSEFRWNKKRKHYSYLYKCLGSKRKNILISSQKYVFKTKNGKKKIILMNVPLYHHPNKSKNGQYYVIPKIYIDDIESFDVKIYENWCFDKNDKRKIKRIKKGRRTCELRSYIHPAK